MDADLEIPQQLEDLVLGPRAGEEQTHLSDRITAWKFKLLPMSDATIKLKQETCMFKPKHAFLESKMHFRTE